MKEVFCDSKRKKVPIKTFPYFSLIQQIKLLYKRIEFEDQLQEHLARKFHGMSTTEKFGKKIGLTSKMPIRLG